MRIQNVHARAISKTPEETAVLIAQLGSSSDPFWPHQRWPAMRFDRPIGVGAIGGHGPIAYTVTAFEPSKRVVFEFTAPKGFLGHHTLELVAQDRGCVLRHEIAMRLGGWATLTWPLLFAHLHNALIEDALDRAEAWASNTPYTPRPLGGYIFFLRSLRGLLRSRHKV